VVQSSGSTSGSTDTDNGSHLTVNMPQRVYGKRRLHFDDSSDSLVEDQSVPIAEQLPLESMLRDEPSTSGYQRSVRVGPASLALSQKPKRGKFN
jgi:hypothetical protein